MLEVLLAEVAAHTPGPAPACRRHVMTSGLTRGTVARLAERTGTRAVLGSSRAWSTGIICDAMDDPMPIGATCRVPLQRDRARTRRVPRAPAASTRTDLGHPRRGDLRRRGLGGADRRAEARVIIDRARRARHRGRAGRAQPGPQPRARARAARRPAHSAALTPRHPRRPDDGPGRVGQRRRAPDKRRQSERKRDRPTTDDCRPRDALARRRDERDRARAPTAGGGTATRRC